MSLKKVNEVDEKWQENHTNKNQGGIEMKIKELQIGYKEVDIVVEVVDIGEIRTIHKGGREITVATARVKDDSGEMDLSLWNKQIDMAKVGGKLHIINGYVSQFNEEPQLTTGKFGKLEPVKEEKQVKIDTTEKDFKKTKEDI